MTDNGVAQDHGRLYWLVHHTKRRLFEALRRNRKRFIGLGLLTLVVMLCLRSYFHPAVIGLRNNLFILIVLIPIVLFLRWRFVRSEAKGRVFVGLVAVSLFLLAVLWGRVVHNYLSLYYRYATLEQVELTELPESDFERIQPRNSVFSLAHEAMTEAETPMVPDFVRVGDQYRWTLAIEPAYPISRITGGISELLSVPGTTAAPTFLAENRIPVSFEVGENLLIGHNSHIATIRAFGLWRYLNYEPADVSYVPDDEGKWVQVVSLIRWRGLLFPRPEFGGVQLIRQSQTSLGSTVELFLTGAGQWIPPEKIKDHPFLVGQNILPLQISRYIGGSFRFQNGFFAPLPGYHSGDIRIPDLPEDVNDQPFSVYFRASGAMPAMLYHYFALEPFDPEKQGLNTSIFIPADGTSHVYVYKHSERDGSLTGVSAIAAKVMESRKQYDWSRNRPVEHRPFIRDISGKRRFFWLTTVVTMKEKAGAGRFIAGSAPEVVLTDAAYNTPIWVNPQEPESWVPHIEREMRAVWK